MALFDDQKPRPTAEEVTWFHTFAQVDTRPEDIHHTLGVGHNQAARGDDPRFNLSNPGTIPDRLAPTGALITDWNNAIEDGFYYGISPLNGPAAFDGGSGSWQFGTTFWHSGAGSPRMMQEVHEARGTMYNFTYRRYWNGTTWSAWVLEGPIVMFHGTLSAVTHGTSGTFVTWGASGAAYTEYTDAFAMHDPTTNPTRIKITQPGLYRITARMSWAASTTGLRTLLAAKNGTALNGLNPQWNTVDNNGGNFGIDGVEACVNGDYLEIQTRQTSGGSLVMNSGVVTVEWLNP